MYIEEYSGLFGQFFLNTVLKNERMTGDGNKVYWLQISRTTVMCRGIVSTGG